MAKFLFPVNNGGGSGGGGDVTSVNSKTGDVQLNYSDVGAPSKTEFDALQTQVQTDSNNLAQIETDVDAVESSVDALTTKVSDIETEIDNLETKVNTVESDVNTLKLDVTTLDSILSDHENLKVASTNGVHGIRYENGSLFISVNGIEEEFKGGNGTTWNTF